MRVHPTQSGLVYVAALGHAHGPNPERGIFRSRDGGATWEHVLFRGQDAGANDLCMDPNNPRILYASFWETRRGPWQLTSGGPGSGLFKSTDGGDTWTDISPQQGPAQGRRWARSASPPRARSAIASGPSSRPRTAASSAPTTAARPGSGSREERDLRQRAWYYQHIIADPHDAETVWVLNIETWRSIDGGKTFSAVRHPARRQPRPVDRPAATRGA